MKKILKLIEKIEMRTQNKKKIDKSYKKSRKNVIIKSIIILKKDNNIDFIFKQYISIMFCYSFLKKFM